MIYSFKMFNELGVLQKNSDLKSIIKQKRFQRKSEVNEVFNMTLKNYLSQLQKLLQIKVKKLINETKSTTEASVALNQAKISSLISSLHLAFHQKTNGSHLPDELGESMTVKNTNDFRFMHDENSGFNFLKPFLGYVQNWKKNCSLQKKLVFKRIRIRKRSFKDFNRHKIYKKTQWKGEFYITFQAK